MKGYIMAVVAGAAAITALFIFGANMMLDDADAKRGKKKSTETTAVVAVETKNGNPLHDVFVDQGM